MKVLVCGDREWRSRLKILQALANLPRGTTIIQGGARGADELAHKIALECGLEVVTCEAQWEKYGAAAGPIRNKKMLDLKPDLVLAFHPHLDKSKGTKHCVEEARRRGIPVQVIT